MVGVLSVVGCSSSGSGSSDGDPARELAERVHDVLQSSAGATAVADRLGQFGVSLAADDLASADVLCPRVDDPSGGDLATCRVTVGEQRFEVDVEFSDEGSLQVVDAEVAQ